MFLKIYLRSHIELLSFALPVLSEIQEFSDEKDELRVGGGQFREAIGHHLKFAPINILYAS